MEKKEELNPIDLIGMKYRTSGASDKKPRKKKEGSSHSEQIQRISREIDKVGISNWLIGRS